METNVERLMVDSLNKSDVISQVMNNPNVKEKMRQYVYLMTGQDAPDNTAKLVAKVAMIKEGIKGAYKRSLKKDFLTPQALANFEGTSDFDMGLDSFEADLESSKGFDSFDPQSVDSLDPTPAGLAAGVLKGVGKKIVSKVQKVNAAKAQAKSLKDKAADLHQTAQLVENGIKNKDLSAAGDAIMANPQLAKMKTVKFVNDSIQKAKTDAEKSEIKKHLPLIIAIVVIIVLLSFYFGKKLG